MVIVKLNGLFDNFLSKSLKNMKMIFLAHICHLIIYDRLLNFDEENYLNGVLS